MMTTSADNCFMRQFSCARSNWRMMSTSSGSSMRARMIGKSPEIPCDQSVEISSELRASTSAVGRRVGSTYRTAFARRWNSSASSEVMPRWCNCTCDCVHASVCVRSKVRASRYLSARSKTSSRVDATMVEKIRWTVPPAGTNRAAQAEDGVQHGTNGVGEWPAIHHRNRIAQIAGPAHEAGAIRFKLHFTDGFAVGDHDMGDPDRSFVVGAFAARGYQRVDVWHIFSFDEKFGDSGVSNIRGLGREREFRVGS